MDPCRYERSNYFRRVRKGGWQGRPNLSCSFKISQLFLRVWRRGLWGAGGWGWDNLICTNIIRRIAPLGVCRWGRGIYSLGGNGLIPPSLEWPRAEVGLGWANISFWWELSGKSGWFYTRKPDIGGRCRKQERSWWWVRIRGRCREGVRTWWWMRISGEISAWFRSGPG